MWKQKLIWIFFVFGILKGSMIFGVETEVGPKWGLSIAVPESNGVHVIQLSPAQHFHVVLQNRSKTPQKIWKNSNSWGYPALYFEVVDEAGIKKIIRKQSKNWRKNAPGYWTINDGEYLVYDISLASKDWGFVFQNNGEVRHLKIKAVIEISADSQTRKYGVWTGLIRSTEYDIDVF